MVTSVPDQNAPMEVLMQRALAGGLWQGILLFTHKARHTCDGNRPYKPWVYAIAVFRFADGIARLFACNIGALWLRRDRPVAGESRATLVTGFWLPVFSYQGFAVSYALP